MSHTRHQPRILRKKPRNVTRPRQTFVEQLRAAGRRATVAANQPFDGGHRHIRATLAQEREFAEMEMTIGPRLLRWLVALLLLPVCFVTTYTLISQFSHETLQRRLWVTREFWYFATGALLMGGWFFSGLLRQIFLWLYVLGHELTHALFVYCFLGKVSGFKVSVDGGYIATNKSNLLISLSPYFVPFWSLLILGVYGISGYCFTLPAYADQILYALLGASWTFHLLWTLWMIPRDQPDLKENDTFFSLVVIYLMNILLLTAMLCFCSRSLTYENYGAAWWIHAEHFLRMAMDYFQRGS
jgi:hypothetical protein